MRPWTKARALILAVCGIVGGTEALADGPAPVSAPVVLLPYGEPEGAGEKLHPPLSGPISGPIAGPIAEATSCPPGGCATDCGCERGPLLQFRAHALYMRRGNPGDRPLVRTDAGATILNANSFNFDFEPGWEVDGILNLNERWGAQLRYFQIDNWDSSQTRAVPGGLATYQYATPIGSAVNQIIAGYSSELRSAEINGRFRMNNWLTVFGGFRYLELSESLTFLDTVVGGAPESFRNRTDNKLYGGQIGAEGTWTFGKFGIETVGRFGIFQNNADADVNIVFSPAEGALANRSVSDSRTAYVGEVGLTGTYQLTRNLQLRGGYQVLWINNVSTASEQVQNLNPSLLGGPASRVNANTDLFYHGFVFGAEFRW